MNTKQRQWLAWGAVAMVLTIIAIFLGVTYPVPSAPGENVEVLGTTLFDNLRVTGTSDLRGTVSDGAGTFVVGDDMQIAGAADAIQLKVTGYTTQTASLLVLEQVGGADVLTIGPSGDMYLARTAQFDGNLFDGLGDFTIADNAVITGTSDLQGNVADSLGTFTIADDLDVTGVSTLSTISTGEISGTADLEIYGFPGVAGVSNPGYILVEGGYGATDQTGGDVYILGGGTAGTGDGGGVYLQAGEGGNGATGDGGALELISGNSASTNGYPGDVTIDTGTANPGLESNIYIGDTNAGTVVIGSGLGSVDLNGALEINNIVMPAAVQWTQRAEVGDTIWITGQLQDATGQNVAGYWNLVIYLSDAATGAGTTSTLADDVVDIQGGYLIAILEAKIAWSVLTNSSGQIVISIGHSGAHTWYEVVCLPFGMIEASPAITFAGP